ncbi:MAG TPA: tetratricopeptide repeat protein [Steroidobacteraceae bacterium]|nr:tetratricopeptide repeat protein [Steroidobacteraceae bacterium]
MTALASLVPDSDLERTLREAVAALQRGQMEEAEEHLCRALELRPTGRDALFHYAGVMLRRKTPAKALAAYERALLASSQDAQLYVDQANLFGATGQLERALESYCSAARLRPGDANIHHGLGLVLYSLRRMSEAAQCHAEAIRLRPVFVDALNDHGIAVYALGRFEEAIASYDAAIRLRPQYAQTHYNRANALCELQRYAEAVAGYQEAIARGMQSAELLNNIGVALQHLGRAAEAFGYLRTAVEMSPEYAEAWYNQGLALAKLYLYAQAIASHERACALRPRYIEALVSRGNALMELRRPADALPLFEQALEIEPRFPWLRGFWLYARVHLGEWADWEEEVRRLADEVAAGAEVAMPLVVTALLDSPPLQRSAAQAWVAAKRLEPQAPVRIEPPRGAARIRVGYFSADFHTHPVAILSARMLELHDRGRFEVFAFSFGPNVEDPMRRRLQSACEHFVDVRMKNEEEIVELARSSGLDVAVDLLGFTARQRPGVFARRAAPVQVSYLGYAGTLGAAFMDYLIADRAVIPEDMRDYYTEKVVYLPHCFQVNDNTRSIAERLFTRGELGLPDDAFVFCCFNNIYKIQPAIFGSWMRILRRTPRSVLWLAGAGERAQANLAAEAYRRGIDPERIIFAPRMPRMDEHLARHRAADLFLDTLPFNAHTTASDALWAGLPLLTVAGNSYAGRVASSLLRALGLEELITQSAEEYEEMAVALAADRPRLADVRARLERARRTMPLFDTAGFTRVMESAYRTMIERCRAGLPPDHLDIPAER